MPTIDAVAPLRTCLGCRARRPRVELVRVTRRPAEGGIDVCVDGPSSGRGVWVCRDRRDCLDRAVDRRQFDRAWRTRLDDEDRERIRELVATVIGSPPPVGRSNTDESAR